MRAGTPAFRLLIPGPALPSFSTFSELARYLLDFVLVFVIVYYTIRLIRGTRAILLMLAILGLIVLYFVSQDGSWGRLPTLHFILERFMTWAFVVVVIIFQKDIRIALMRLGHHTFFRGMESGQETQLIEELVKGCTLMAGKRIGALVVMERDTDLGAYTEEAVQLDAMVSEELLEAIFNPLNNNPLHDGAAIVRNGRIVAAGCFLPLSSSPRISQSLGTRHRAGIGISEDSDAIVLIVSEETGTISLAMNGELERGFDANRLRAALQEHLVRRKRREKPETERRRQVAKPAHGVAGE